MRAEKMVGVTAELFSIVFERSWQPKKVHDDCQKEGI